MSAPLITHSSCLFSFWRGCVWLDLPHGGQVWGLYGWAVHPHPSLLMKSHLPTNLASDLIWGQWATLGCLGQWSPNTILVSVEVNTTIPGAFHHLSSTTVVSFSAHPPLSSHATYIYTHHLHSSTLLYMVRQITHSHLGFFHSSCPI